MPPTLANGAEKSYRVRWRGDVSGPFSASELRALFLAGRVSRYHQVSTDGVTWKQFQAWPGLMPAGDVPRPGPGGGLSPPPSALRPSTNGAGPEPPPVPLVEPAPGPEPRPAAGDSLGAGPDAGVFAGMPAGFGRRCAAALLDGVALAAANACAAGAFLLSGRDLTMLGRREMTAAVLVEVYLVWVYCSAAESSRWQGTFGKRVFGLRVADLLGRRVSLGRASVRLLAKLVTALSLGLGLLPAMARGGLRQALHDRLAGTVVLQ